MATPPIFVADRDGPDIAVFRSVGKAEGFLEPIDVLNGESDLYDAEGHELSVSVHARRTVISADGPLARATLTERLRQFFEATGVEMPSQSDWRTFIESSAAAIEGWERQPRRARR